MISTVAEIGRLSTRQHALYRQIKSEVTRLCGDARTRPILVVDEAHHLRPDALAQRIVARYHMAALTREELTGYLGHRLRLASAEVALFDPSAAEAIYQATGGLPRKINLLARHTLLAAALTRAKLATADHVQAALPEIA